MKTCEIFSKYNSPLNMDKLRQTQSPTPKSWDSLYKSLGQFTDDFMPNGREQPIEQEVRETLCAQSNPNNN